MEYLSCNIVTNYYFNVCDIAVRIRFISYGRNNSRTSMWLNNCIFPLVIFGINWRMGSYFTIITQSVWFLIFSKLVFFFFQKESYAPIVYYCGLIINVTALLWCIVIKVYKPLENEIYRYPWGEWMVPHYDDRKIERMLRLFDLSCSIAAIILGTPIIARDCKVS